MPRQTLVQALMRAGDGGDPVAETWSILTHEVGGEYWSEVLDGARHPHVRHDEYGYDTVIKYYGDSIEESRRAALDALRELVARRGGRVEGVGEMEDTQAT